MSIDNKNCHLTREDRVIIETGICNECSSMKYCRYDIYKYTANIAQKDYENITKYIL